MPLILIILCRDVLRIRYSLCLIKEMVETYINKLGKISESPMGFEPITFRTPGGCSTD